MQNKNNKNDKYDKNDKHDKNNKYDNYFYKNSSHQMTFKEKQLSIYKNLEIKKTEIIINNDKVNLNKFVQSINKNNSDKFIVNNITNNNNNKSNDCNINNNINITNINIIYNNNDDNDNNDNNDDNSDNDNNNIIKRDFDIDNYLDEINNIENDIENYIGNINDTFYIDNIENTYDNKRLLITSSHNNNSNNNINTNINTNVLKRNYISNINTIEYIKSLKPTNIKCVYEIYYKTIKEKNNIDTWKKKDKNINKENTWKKNKNNDDNKINETNILLILNKISKDNYKQLITEIKNYDYKNIKIVNMIFIKALNEINYMEIYADICYELKDIYDLINNLSEELYKTKRNKYLCKFIGLLYKRNIIKDEMINYIINDLKSYNNMNKTKEMKEEDIDNLCMLINTLTLKDKSLKKIEIDKYLINIKDNNDNNISKKYKYMIMDILGL